jgi:hypothetical protein
MLPSALPAESVGKAATGEKACKFDYCETKPIPGLQLIREAIGRRLGAGSNRRSFDFFDEYTRLPEQRLQLAALVNGLACIEPLLQRIFIAARGARSGRTAMHPTSSFAAYRRRHAGLA